MLFFPALLWLELEHEVVHGDDGKYYALLIRKGSSLEVQASNCLRDWHYTREFLSSNKDIPLSHGCHREGVEQAARAVCDATRH